MNDVFVYKSLWDEETARIDIVKTEEPPCQVTDCFSNVDPVFTFVKMDIADVMRFNNVEVFVLPFAKMGVNDNRAIVTRVNQRRVIAVHFHGSNDTVELPRGSRAARKEEVPRDIDLQRGIDGSVDDLLVSGEIKQPMIVADNS